MQITNNTVKYEVFLKQYLHAILDISESLKTNGGRLSVILIT